MTLKYLAKLTALVTTTFRADNHRGEPRWERNAVDALLTQGKIVHSTNRIWHSALEKPANLYDEIHQEWMDESIQISYGVPHEIYTGHYPDNCDPKYRIVQYQDGPSEQTKDTFLKYDRRLPGSIVATCAFKSGNYLARLERTLGKQNVEWHYGPTVPEIFPDHDSCSQTNLLWAYRNFCAYAERDPNGMRKLFNKVAGYMKESPDARLVMLVQPSSHANSLLINKDCRGYFFNFPFTKALTPYKDRVDVLTAINWYEVMEIMSKTRLVISPAEPLGGPPFEAASYGIPIVLESTTNPFCITGGAKLFPEVLTAAHGISPQFFNQLDRLNSDPAYYRKHGNAYRNFVGQHATYESYVNKLEDIAKQRGWQ